ncbi:MAG: hypothetical protein IKW97_08205 [Muribaculaceae bacterium]|nr:hypothetical protein [Muribaculaceae bacterium]
MKIKLTTLLFGLLLAVGWTSNASAQALPELRAAERYILYQDAGMPNPALTDMMEPGAMLQHKELKKSSGTRLNAPLREARNMVSLTAAEASALKYSYKDVNGTLHENVPATEVANDPAQMYSLLKFIYKTKAFPGPYTSAYTANGVEEREVYYGGIEGGWNIDGQTTTSTVQEMPDINIVAGSYGVHFRSITVTDASTGALITSWNYNDEYTSIESNGNTYTYYKLPSGWNANGRYLFRASLTNYYGTTYYYGAISSGDESGTITISRLLLKDHSSVKVTISAVNANYSGYSASLKVNDGTSYTVSTSPYTGTEYSWTINAQNVTVTNQVSDIYKPTQEGYTVLVVSVKDSTTPATVEYNDYESHLPISLFSDSTDLVEYFQANVNYIKLLTDGLRITDAAGNPGTVFNCDGTYNKFFFLGKGQARQKDPEVIRLQRTYGLMGERVPFKEMYEEFSPTQGDMGSQITDFYDKMREGSVYDVVHDCGSVIENGHQFSMSGNNATNAYPLTGLNFFVPDYRLKYWEDDYYINYTNGTQEGPFHVDGRSMNPYKETDGSIFQHVPSFCVNYAQYNPDYAPKVGIYKITLSAIATQVDNSREEDNENFVVTLTWISSLNEMAGYEVPQTYTIYLIDNVTGERIQLEATGVTNPTGQTTVSYLVPQRAHSYSLEYIIMGRPDGNGHPSFVAWSNRDNVIIPGWDDFIGLKLHHHESDFKVNEMANYYRNFLEVLNEDLYGGLTVDKINSGMNEFTLYRFLYKDTTYTDGTTELVPVNDGTPIAKLKFSAPDADGNVPYTVTYLNNSQTVEDYTLRPTVGDPVPNAYSVQNLEIPLQDVIRIKGNGDIVIWPNGYSVNFKSIKVYEGNSLRASWEVADGDLPEDWIVSPGSIWYIYNNDGEMVGYMDGGGYIAIPGIVASNNVNDLRVEIVAYGDGASVSRIIVNDHTQTIENGNIKTYVWGGTGQDAVPISPNAAPRRDNNNNK